MAERGITGEVADEILKMKAFANYGFPESHSVSFAYLVYASAWIKYHEPAAFCAALLNAQPMGFWSPHTLVRDARRHGVEVRTPDLAASRPAPPSNPRCGCGGAARGRVGAGHRFDELAERIVAERDERGPYRVTSRTSCGGCPS
jgi:error-prone DNA polymerase